ncbi:PhzF family phenazine biosynthesis protein [Demequina sp. SYSU T00192]|uniref:PhzF family phenazine biosynthesis protein n=1 Tax=Demequina litoralis TaxID=3051660 RepID=A0ABT8G6L7_9MICO|nr:PhzF family phenazine biosynthesis protein [Demequina sp. SYSU T00192]MDN4474781.1 PhzF family phenazine biosynthesis protein [Demequina sp. SYSU T00192]
MSTHPFRQVDVFGSGPFTGNPVAVVLDADGLADADMARIARWTNLSETTFVLPPTTPEADYRVRIFTVAEELPFAGHPTLGTARAWLDAGGVPRGPGALLQECGVGLVPVRVDGDRLAFAAPPLRRSGPVSDVDLDEACARLRLSRDEIVAAAWVDNGPGWMGLLLRDADRVLAVVPDGAARAERGFYGVAGLHGDGSDADLEVRAFMYDAGTPMAEDPVTGSLNASLAQWFAASGVLVAPYVAAQGTAIGRAGRATVEEADGSLWIGGATDVAITGTIEA